MKKFLILAVVAMLSGASVYAQGCCSSKKADGEKKGCCCSQKKSVAASVELGDSVQFVTFKADQIKCNGCAGKVVRTLKANEGVKDVTVTLEDKHVKVAYDPKKTDVAGILAEFDKIEYKVEGLKD